MTVVQLAVMLQTLTTNCSYHTNSVHQNNTATHKTTLKHLVLWCTAVSTTTDSLKCQPFWPKISDEHKCTSTSRCINTREYLQ